MSLDLLIHRPSRVVIFGDKGAKVGHQQAQILFRLADAGGQVVPHAELEALVWPSKAPDADPRRAMRWRIALFRRQFPGIEIALVWGVGWCLLSPVRWLDG